MAQMSNTQARVVDAVNTGVVRGFEHPDQIGEQLFPVVNVTQRGGKIMQFNRDSFKLYNTGRAAGSKTNRIQFGYGTIDYALEDHRLEAYVPNETAEEAASIGIDMVEGPLFEADKAMRLGLEKQRADIARTAASYQASNKTAVTGVDRFDTSTGNPFTFFRAGREAIRAKTGLYPNVAEIPAPVMEALLDNPFVVDRVKYTTGGLPTEEGLARLLRIPRILVAPSVYVDDSDVQQDVWGKDIVLAYVNVAPLTRRWMGSPSAFYTYQMAGYPYVAMPYPDNNANSMAYPIAHCRKPVGASFDAAYLMQTCIN